VEYNGPQPNSLIEGASIRFHWQQLAPVAILSASLAAQTSGINPVLLAKASAGDAQSQVLIGDFYAAGTVVAHDLKLAAEWYKRAADQDNLAGELHLADLYRDGGKGFPRELTQAVAWYRKAAEQGDATAQGNLGLLYSIGQGVPHDDLEAYYWLDLAAAVPGPNQQKYAANRQLIGTHITTDELEEVEERVAKWKAAHPRPQ